MQHARQAGFPVPAVASVSGPDMVVARIDGRTMAQDLARRPWRLSAHARTLGGLHRRLHAIVAPAALVAPLGEGEALLHLDLHPENVLLGTNGPWVIDWANAARGPAAADVAMTFVILGAFPRARSPYGAFIDLLRRRFAVEFLTAAGSAGVRGSLPAVAARRLADTNLHDDERRAVEDLVRRMPAP